MYGYTVSPVFMTDRKAKRKVEALLEAEGIRLDNSLDYTCGIYEDDGSLIATGSCCGNTLRCLAVSHSHQGEGLMNLIISHLVSVQFERGNTHLFLYTKSSAARFFGDLGFYEIIRIEDQVVFMENRRNGFSAYLDRLRRETEKSIKSINRKAEEAVKREIGEAVAGGAVEDGMNRPSKADTVDNGIKQHAKVRAINTVVKSPAKVGAVVMNANPFTLGHRYLVETAARECDVLHLFILSEDVSVFPFSVRKNLVIKGTEDIPDICYHDSGPYIISNATFPSYFQKDERAVVESHARLDLEVFSRIAATLGITDRYIGEEPHSAVTSLYNELMETLLPEHGIRCHVIPRRRVDGEGSEVISASDVRKAIQTGDEALLEKLVPESTLSWLHSKEAEPVVELIRQAQDVIH